MAATLLPLTLLLLSAAALVLKVVCHRVYTRVQAPARRASSPRGPGLPPILKMGNQRHPTASPPHSRGTSAGSHTAVFWNLMQPSAPVPPLSLSGIKQRLQAPAKSLPLCKDRARPMRAGGSATGEKGSREPSSAALLGDITAARLCDAVRRRRERKALPEGAG